jgi:hypothetical protein
MYLGVPTQPSCAMAWLAASQLVDAAPGHEAGGVIQLKRSGSSRLPTTANSKKSREEVYNTERRLLCVACTLARDHCWSLEPARLR